MLSSKCPICSNPGVPYMISKDYNRRITSKIFSYYKCSSCRLIYLVNVPENLSKYYPTHYYCIPADKQILSRNSNSEMYKVDLLCKFIKRGKILEIGPAYGFFAFLASQVGFEVNVIEMDRKCCEFIRKEFTIKAIQSENPTNALKELPCYDAIVMWHVIEHLAELNCLLREVSKKILPGGILIVSTPNPLSFQFHVLRGYWTHLDAPRHLQLIPSDLLVRKMEELGFRCVLLTTRDKGSIGWNSFGWAVSFRNMFKHAWLQYISYSVGRLLAKCLVSIESHGHNGSAYTVVFQKAKENI